LWLQGEAVVVDMMAVVAAEVVFLLDSLLLRKELNVGLL
jgi:hypothetical protein